MAYGYANEVADSHDINFRAMLPRLEVVKAGSDVAVANLHVSSVSTS